MAGELSMFSNGKIKNLIIGVTLMPLVFTLCKMPTEEDIVGAYVYTLTYDGNGNTGGSPPPPRTRLAAGQKVPISVAGISKLGYEFKGWSPTLTPENDNDLLNVGKNIVIGNSSITLYAIWQRKDDPGRLAGRWKIDGESYYFLFNGFQYVDRTSDKPSDSNQWQDYTVTDGGIRNAAGVVFTYAIDRDGNGVDILMLHRNDPSADYRCTRDLSGGFSFIPNADGCVTITAYSGPAGTVRIPAQLLNRTVSAIGKLVFRDRRDITAVSFEDKLTSIGDDAFNGCSLSTIFIPGTVTTIGAGAFANNPLTKITIATGIRDMVILPNSAGHPPPGITGITLTPPGTAEPGEEAERNKYPRFFPGIGVNAFAGASYTAANRATLEFTNPAATEPAFSIGDSAFARLNLTGTLILPNRVTEQRIPASDSSPARVFPGIGTDGFAENSLGSVSFGNRVRMIGNGAFRNNQLAGIVIPSQLTHIGIISAETAILPKGAFENNPPLEGKTLSIPDAVEEIGPRAFAENKILALSLGAGVKNIGEAAFISNNVVDLVIPGKVISIGKSAFKDNPNLISLRLSAADQLETIGDYAFMGDKIGSILIPPAVSSIGKGAFKDQKSSQLAVDLSLARNYKKIEDSTFSGNTKNLTEIVLPDWIQFIGKSAFWQAGLKEIVIPQNVKTIGAEAFWKVPLQKITIQAHGFSYEPENLSLAKQDELFGTFGSYGTGLSSGLSISRNNPGIYTYTDTNKWTYTSLP